MRDRKLLVRPAAVLLLALTAAGCGSTRAADDLPSDPVAREKALGERLSLRDPRTGSEGGMGFLELTLANSGSSSVATRCAPEWYDAQGEVVSAATDWQDVELAAGQERKLRFAPMPASARSWRLRFAP